MKKLLLIIILAVFSLYNNLFPTFEASLNVSAGVNFTIPSIKGEGQIKKVGKNNQNRSILADYSKAYPYLGYDLSVLAQIGGSFDLNNKTGVTSLSLLADLGYAPSQYKIWLNSKYYAKYQYWFFHSVNVGAIFKININLLNHKYPFSIGIGGGVKFPVAAVIGYTIDSNIEDKYNYLDIKKMFNYPIIPYIKITMDSYLYITKKTAVILTSYLGYDFGMEYDAEKFNNENNGAFLIPYPFKMFELNKFSFSSVNLGVSVGIYFGRSNTKL